jgi:2-amino-4-hydroxy-6-hydroxymethyldihydropteridine diphosphokinase
MPEPLAATAFIGLGANLGDRGANIHAALARLRKSDGIAVGAVSSLLENPAVGGPAGSPPFLNAVARIETTLPPRILLHQLLAIEADLGRARLRRWEPRVIDLDLLLYGNRIVDEPGLTLPHPRLHVRRFVLLPLAEISPDTIHPTFGKTIRRLLDELPAES